MVSPEGHSHERCSGYLGWPFFLVISLTYDEESKTEELAKEFVLWEKRLSPRRALKRSLLPLSPRRTQVRLIPLLFPCVWPSPEVLPPPRRPLQRKSTVCGLK
jgi:hypothetical protein